MPAHWTYQDILDPNVDLEQGDILYPSEGLLSLFEEVHPHFKDSKYLGFLVATQSCDLVRRGGVPKAGYVELAVIRPLSQLLPKLFSQVITPAASGLYPLSGREEAKRLLARIFNQNEQGIGLFFLYPEAALRIGEPAVAMLRVTVAVRKDHYSRLLESRVGRLEAEFQAKLGWLLGNLYNRPATPDWADHDGGAQRFDQLVKEFVGEVESGTNSAAVRWVDDVLIAAAKKQGMALDAMTYENFEALKPAPALERALDEILLQLEKVAPETHQAISLKLRNRLTNSGKFRALIKG